MAERAEVRKRRAKALAIRERGASVDEIHEALGYRTNHLVRNDIRQARADALTVRVRDPLVGGLLLDVLTSRDRRVHRFIAQRAKEREHRLAGRYTRPGCTYRK